MAIEVKQYLDYPGLQDYDNRIKNWFKQLSIAQSEELQASIDALEALVGEDSVDERIAAAVANIIDSAPETFDTLKEIADWIETHGEAAAALIESVAQLGQDLAAVDNKVDDVYSAIQPIPGSYIEALFLASVAYDSSKSLTEQIASLGENEKLVIEEPVIDEDISISSDCVIEAEGVKFTGNIVVAKDAKVTVMGATFSGTVTVQ